MVVITVDELRALYSGEQPWLCIEVHPTTITVQDGSTIPSSVLEFAIPPESSLSSDAKPHILIPESSPPSITDLAGNGAPEISITVSDGIAPSMQSAIVVSPSLIEVIFDEDIKFTSANALFHPAPTVNGIPTDTPEDISGNILRVPSENAFPSDTTLSVTIATNIITDIAGNIFEPGTILTSAANVLVPYTVDEITIHIPYAMTLNLNTLSTDDYSITFGSNPPSSISTVDLSTDAITVILTMNTPFGTGDTPFVEQIGDITDTLLAMLLHCIDGCHTIKRTMFAIPPESSLSSDAKPHILIPESSPPSIRDLAGNGAPEISITVSDGIAPSMQSAIVVSPSLIEVIFDEDIKFTSANALFHPAPTVNGIPTDTPEDISGNILRVPSENAFPSDTTLSVTIATNIITDIAGNIFEPGTILTSAANVLVPYTVDEITIHIPYAMTLNLNTLSTDDYSITFGSNPPSSISTVDLSTDAITDEHSIWNR